MPRPSRPSHGHAGHRAPRRYDVDRRQLHRDRRAVRRDLTRASLHRTLRRRHALGGSAGRRRGRRAGAGRGRSVWTSPSGCSKGLRSRAQRPPRDCSSSGTTILRTTTPAGERRCRLHRRRSCSHSTSPTWQPWSRIRLGPPSASAPSSAPALVSLPISGADDEPAASVSIGDCSIALFPLPSAERAESIWGTPCLARGSSRWR